MGKFVSSLLEAIVLAGIATGIGLYANSRMGRGAGLDPNQAVYVRPSLDPTFSGDIKPAFPKQVSPSKNQEGSDSLPMKSNHQNNDAAVPDPEESKDVSTAVAAPKGSSASTGGADPGETPTAYFASPKHEFRAVIAETVLEILQDPMTESGLNVFVDARDQKHFDEGHMPGALMLDPMRPGLFLEGVVARATEADRVIVYCNGGECEDSAAVCRQLLANGINKERIYLYEGGWEEWTKLGYPVEGKDGE